MANHRLHHHRVYITDPERPGPSPSGPPPSGPLPPNPPPRPYPYRSVPPSFIKTALYISPSYGADGKKYISGCFDALVLVLKNWKQDENTEGVKALNLLPQAVGFQELHEQKPILSRITEKNCTFGGRLSGTITILASELSQDIPDSGFLSGGLDASDEFKTQLDQLRDESELQALSHKRRTAEDVLVSLQLSMKHIASDLEAMDALPMKEEWVALS